MWTRTKAAHPAVDGVRPPPRKNVPEMAAGDAWSMLPVGVTVVAGSIHTGRSMLLGHLAELHAGATLLPGGNQPHPLGVGSPLELAMVLAPGRAFLVDSEFAEAPPLMDDRLMERWRALAVDMGQQVAVVTNSLVLRAWKDDRGCLPAWVDRMVMLGNAFGDTPDLRPFGVPQSAPPELFEYVAWSPLAPADYALRRVPRRAPVLG